MSRLPVRIVAFAALAALAACGGGGGGDDDGGNPPAGDVTVTGRVTFDRVPHDPFTSALDYGGTFESPARRVAVEAISDADGATVLDATETDEQGEFTLSLPASTRVFLRAYAELLERGSPGWHVMIVDNTQSQALYVLETEAFGTGMQDSIHDVHAGSGWNGSSYTDARSAAPFAILDSVYDAMSAVLAVDADAVFPDLVVNWSPDNVPVAGDPADGQITTTFYTPDPDPQIYVLGSANDDTDEYDGQVIQHEYGHYLEDSFGRSDSIGGPHAVGDLLDPRVAVSEGWGYAFAGIASGDPVVHDSFGNRQQLGFAIDIDRNDQLNAGWYSEGSVQSVLYDLYDDDADGVDSVSLGLAPLFDALTGAQRDTPLLTMAFPMLAALRSDHPADEPEIDALLAAQDITGPGMDDAGSTEANDAGSADVLPVYTELHVDGASRRVCSTDEFGTFNKLSNSRFLYFEVIVDRRYQVIADGGPAGSDPDLWLYRDGIAIAVADSVSDGEERIDDIALEGGLYVLEIYEYSNVAADPVSRGRTCFDVRVESF